MKQWLTLAALLVVSSAAAQAPSAAFEMTATSGEFLMPDATNEIPIEVTVGCMEVVENMGEADVTVTIAEPPVWLNVTPLEVHVGIEDCLGNEAVTVPETLLVDVFGAPGLEPLTLTVQAALGSHTTTAELTDLLVDYLPGHTMDPAGDQVFDVAGGSHAFDLTLDITANAKTMIMFEDKVVSGAASLTGLKANIFDVAAGDRQLVSNILFTAPTGHWTEETVTFYTYSHCLDKEGCGPQFAENVTWTFRNTDPIPVGAQAESQDTPAGGWFMAIAAATIVLVARRRV